jgi:hypothetical protein
LRRLDSVALVPEVGSLQRIAVASTQFSKCVAALLETPLYDATDRQGIKTADICHGDEERWEL